MATFEISKFRQQAVQSKRPHKGSSSVVFDSLFDGCSLAYLLVEWENGDSHSVIDSKLAKNGSYSPGLVI